jgi:3-phosphoshikimate 1-carboxyvinyltransferase
MNVVIKNAGLKGSVKAIASKSQAHRLLICAAFADRPTEIVCSETSKDIDATAECLRALGCSIERDQERGLFKVMPAGKINDTAVMDCGESGSTLRFMLPVVCALGVKCKINMHGRLPERPLSPLWEELISHGASLKRGEDGSVMTSGRITSGSYEIDAGISSQFISGLLFAMPLMKSASSVRLTGRVESEDYILMTMDALKIFGVDIHKEGDVLSMDAGSALRSPGSAVVEGDWSNGAFWLCASRMTGGNIKVTGLDTASRQGDKAVIGLIDRISEGDAVIDAKNVPDLVPVLSVLASVSPGTTRFINAGRLRIKESDRIKATVDMLVSLGAEASETEDGIIIKGKNRLEGGSVSSFGDHRMAMSAAVASIACENDVIISGAEAVEKSYPGFWKDFEMLGGDISIC